VNWSDYLIPTSFNYPNRAGFVVYSGETSFQLPEEVKVAIIGVPEDRFSGGAGEIKSPSTIRKQMYALSPGSPGTVIDMGNVRTGKTLNDTYYCIRDLVVELYKNNIITLLLGGTMDLSFGNCLAHSAFVGAGLAPAHLTTVSPFLMFPGEHHPLNKLVFDDTDKKHTLHFCNIGYQSFYVTLEHLDYFNDKHFEPFRLGEARNENIRTVEPVIRDSDLVAFSMNAVKYSDAPAASYCSPNGFSGEEICQLSFFAGLSHKCKSLGIFDIIPQNDQQDITSKLVAQMAWYFIEGAKKRNTDNPKENESNFKKYIIYYDKLNQDLCFYKNIITERWWVEVPSVKNRENNTIISCTHEDYLKASDKEITDRWWKAYHRIND